MATVTIDGEAHEVDPSQVEFGEDEAPDGFVTQDEVDGIVQKRLQRKERQVKSDLKDSDEFWNEMAQARGVELREDGKPKGSLKDDEVEELRRKASKVSSLQDELETLREERQETRRTKLQNRVLQSVDGIQDGAQDDVLANVERNVTYDDEYGWVATDENGDIRYEAGEPVGPQEVANSLREQKPYLFKDTSMQGGPEDEPGTATSTGQTLSRQQFQQEVQKAKQNKDADRLNELQQMAAEDRVTDE